MFACRKGGGAGDSGRAVRRATPKRGEEPAKEAISTGTEAKNLNHNQKRAYCQMLRVIASNHPWHG